MNNVFISYSRRDQVFALRLFERLQQEQLESWADWEGIPYSAAWWEEIKKGIEGAQNFVCILTPAYVSSKICNDELAYARALNKRIIPLMRREVRQGGQFLPDIRAALYGQSWALLAEENDREIARLNYLFCRKKIGYDCEYDEVTKKVTNPECDGVESDADNFETTFLALLDTVRKDTRYVEEHTRLLTLAREWEAANRSSKLLQRDDLVTAEAWLAGSEGKEPQPSDLHRRFIAASRQNANAQRRLLITGLTAGLLIALVLLGLAFISYQNAEFQRVRADANAEEANTQAAAADHNAMTATHLLGQEQIALATSAANLRQAWDSQALFLADESRQQLEADSPHNALLLALESLAHYDTDGVYHPESHQALMNALAYPAQQVLSVEHDRAVRGAVWNAAETRILSWSGDGTARLWDASTGQNLLTLRHPAMVILAQWNRDETRILTASQDGSVFLWDAMTGEQIRLFRQDIGVEDVHWNADETRLLTLAQGGTAYVWDGSSGELLFRLSDPSEGIRGTLGWIEGGTRILTWGDYGSVRLWDAADGSLLTNLPNLGTVTQVSLSNDQALMLAAYSSRISVYDVATGRRLTTLWQNDEDDTAFRMVMAATWSADGNRILSWSNTYSSAESTEGCTTSCIYRAYVWDVTTGKPVTIINHDEAVRGARWNQDESQVLSWSDDGTVRIWTEATSSVITLQHDAPVISAEWTQDETHIHTASSDGRIYIWDAAAGQLLNVLQDSASLKDVQWNADGTRVLARSEDSIHLWNASSRRLLMGVHYDGQVFGARWSADESRILVWINALSGCTLGCSYDVQVWESVPSSTHTLFEHRDWVTSAQWNHDETRLLTTSVDGTARVWDASGNPVFEVTHGSIVRGAAWNQDETRILTWGDDGTARVWDMDGTQLFEVRHYGPLQGVQWSEDGSRILTWSNVSGGGGSEYAAYVWAYKEGRTASLLEDYNSPLKLLSLQHRDPVQGAQWNSDQTRILTWTYSGLFVWDARTGDVIFSHPSDEFIDGAQWSHDGTRIVSWSGTVVLTSQPAAVSVWDVATGQLLVSMNHVPGAEIRGVRWSADDSHLLSWSGDRTARVWDAATGDLLVTLNHSDGVDDARWNRDETRIMTVSNLGVFVWDAAFGERLATMQHDDQVYGAAWNRDESRILSWSADQTARIWDADGGQLILTLRHADRVVGARWNHDETQVLTWSVDGTAQVWTTDLDRLLTIGRAMITSESSLNNPESQQLSLPILVPSAATGIPTSTPLPTLTPSAVPTRAQPEISNFVLTKDVGSDGCALGATDVFRSSAARIYVSARVTNVLPSSTLVVRWFHEGDEVSHFETHIFTPLYQNCVWFYVDQSAFAFVPGNYHVQLELDGAPFGQPAAFVIR